MVTEQLGFIKINYFHLGVPPTNVNSINLNLMTVQQLKI